MGFFGLFKKDSNTKTSTKKGFHEIPVAAVEKLTADTVKVILDVPENLRSEFQFIPGQYVNIALDLNGKEERRSYSICSGPKEPIAFAVKVVKNGKVSTWLNKELLPGQNLFVVHPQGNFILDKAAKNVVAIAAGSGITPILSIAKAMEATGNEMKLFYGNRTKATTIFSEELKQLKHLKITHFLSGENAEGAISGRITKDALTEQIKADLNVLKADAFFICGPEQMILDVSSTLEFFGVAKSKIHFELFTTPVLMKKEETQVSSVFKGESKVKVILDSEVIEFNLNSSGKTILETIEKEGLDAPFSCRGGVCCSCKAKVLNGSATMSMNYSLTDKEVKEGYILTCQAHPSSEELTVSFDA